MTAAISRFIRNIPKESLRMYFDHHPHPISQNIDWDAPANDVVKPLLKAVDEMSGDDLAMLEVNADRIHQMTDEVGQRALLSLVDNAESYRQLESAHDRALWVFIHNPTAFQHAEDIRYADEYRQGRMWDGFLGLPHLPVSRDPTCMEEFRQRVAQYFHTDGNLKVEIFERTRPNHEEEDASLVQVMVYREGMPDKYLAFEKDDLVTKVIRPVYEMALTYEPATGEIEVIAQGRECREELVKMFSATLLQNPLDAAMRVPLKRYIISKLLEPYAFPTDTQDGIDRVTVTLLKLKPYDNGNKVTLEITAKEEKSIYDVSQDWFDANDPLRNGFVLAQVKFSIHFKPDSIHRRGKTLPVKITWPNGCDLKSKTDKERLIGEKYLKHWGLVEEIQ